MHRAGYGVRSRPVRGCHTEVSDNIARLRPGAFGRRAGFNLCDDSTSLLNSKMLLAHRFRAQLLDRDPELPTPDIAMHQNLNDRASHVHRDGKPDSSASSILADDRRVDSNEFAAQTNVPSMYQ